MINLALLLGAATGAGLLVVAETHAASPLLMPAMFRDRDFSASLAMSTLVTTVLMATLIVGPFYLSLSLSLGLDPASVGLVVFIGPAIAAIAGVPSGRITDKLGVARVRLIGLAGVGLGSLVLAELPTALGIPGYICPVVIVTAGYALFQTANNTGVMAEVRAEQPGVVSAVLNLSRNLGLITGASVMGVIFARRAGTTSIGAASPETIAAGMRATFTVAVVITLFASAIALAIRSSGKPC